MEWVETTAKTVDDAKDRALDQLGVGADEAEFEVIEEPRSGLFGRLRGEARVRARVKPASVRPKHDRRQRGRKRDERRKGGKNGSGAKNGSGGKSDDRQRGADKRTAGKRAAGSGSENGGSDADSSDDRTPAAAPHEDAGPRRDRAGSGDGRRGGRGRNESARGGGRKNDDQQTRKDRSMNDEQRESEVSPAEVGDAARAFMDGLVGAFGLEATTEVEVDGTEIDVRVSGSELGLLVGPGGQTLTAVQDLARVAAQRRLGDHDTRLRIDVGGYRQKRREALEKFALAVAEQVRETGTTKALEPMSSADRKVVHDAIAGLDGVSSRSDGDDPARRVVISPD